MITRRSFLRGLSAAASAAIVGAATPAWARALADDTKRMQGRKLWVSPGLSSSVRTAELTEIRFGDTVLDVRGGGVVEWRFDLTRKSPVPATFTMEASLEVDPQSWVALQEGLGL